MERCIRVEISKDGKDQSGKIPAGAVGSIDSEIGHDGLTIMLKIKED